MADALFPGSDDVATLVLEDKRRAQGASATDFLEGFAEEGAPDGGPAALAGDMPGLLRGEGIAPAQKPVPGSAAGRVVGDVGRGLIEAPRQALGGAMDALYAIGSLMNPSHQVGTLESEIDPGTGQVKIVDGKTPEEVQAEARARYEGSVRPGDAQSVTGGLVRGVAQFLTGFAVGGKAVGAIAGTAKAATTLGAVGRAAGQSMLSDFAAFDGHEARLSDLVESVPALRNPITEYLASDQSDSELEGRLKNVAEGVLSDVAITGLVAGLRGIRRARGVRADLGAETYAEAQARLAADPEVGKAVVPEIRAARVTEAPLVAKSVDEIGPEPAAEALAKARVLVGEREVYVNWNRIETGEDVKSVIQQMADAGRDEIDMARRGVRSNAETVLSAEKQNAWRLLVERRRGGTMNAEETLAMRQLWSSSAERLTDAARAVQEAPTPENVFLFRRAVALHGTIQREVIATRTETARALQQWSIPAGSNEVVARQIAETVDAFGGAETASDLAQRIMALAKGGDYGAIDALTRKSALVATADAVHEYWVNALLSGPATHLRNTISNTAVALTAPLERALAAGIGALKGGTDRVLPGEAAAMLQGMTGSLRDAVLNAGRSFVTGESGFGLQKIEMPRARSISAEAFRRTKVAPRGVLRPLNMALHQAMDVPVIAHGIDAFGALVNTPVRALGAEDEFFKTINYRMEVHAQAVREATREIGADAAPDALRARIAELIAEPPDHVSVAARDFAQYNTFTRASGPIVKKISALRHVFPGVRYITPFLKTPAQIMSFAAERSPIAPILPAVRADLAAGGARADMALAKMGLGSTALWLAYDAAMNGQITGSGPSNPAERAALQRTGWQPNSVRIGDRYYAYQGIDPFGMYLGIAANLAELTKSDHVNADEDVSEFVFGAMGSVGQMLMDRTYFTGMSDFFQAMSDPDRYAEGYFQRFAASFVPAAVRQAEGVVDPELRRVANLGDALRARVPGLSGAVPVRHDLWGRPISYASGLGAAYDAISPIYSRKEDAQPIDRELQRLGYFPGMPSTSMTEGGERFPMRNRPDIYERYVVLQGATPASDFPVNAASAVGARMQSYGDMTLMEVLNAIVGGGHALSAEYADGDDAEREKIIERTISDFRRSAKAALQAEFADFFTPGTGVK